MLRRLLQLLQFDVLGFPLAFYLLALLVLWLVSWLNGGPLSYSL